MNILLVSSYLPFPLFSGGHIRLYNLIKELSRKHNITLICEKRDHQGVLEIDELKKFCKKVITVPRKKQWSLGNILKTGISDKPFLVVGHTSGEMKREIQRELNEGQFDLIHVETSYVLQNVPETEVPIVLAEHNIEYLVYKRFVESAPWFIRPLLNIDVLKLRLWEEAAWRSVTKLIAVSDTEKEIMKKVRKDVMLVPNGVDIDKYKFKNIKEDREKTILFIGEFKWMQNRDAIKWIIKEIWPKLRAEIIPSIGGGVRLWVVGRSIPKSIRNLAADKSIIFDENAPRETELIYQRSDILLAPIRVGGGTSYKVLESMASGLPVITTALGNAIKARENEEIITAEDALSFVVKIKRLLEDSQIYEKISKNARKLIEKKYNWKIIAQDLNTVYESLIPYA